MPTPTSAQRRSCRVGFFANKGRSLRRAPLCLSGNCTQCSQSTVLKELYGAAYNSVFDLITGPGYVKSNTNGSHPVTTMSEAAEKPVHRPISEQDIEVLLASANAIQRLIDERNELRNQEDMLERELERLKDQTTLYRRLTREFISQVQLVDGFREPAGENPAEQTAGARVTLHKSA